VTTFFKQENPKLADFSPEHLESFYQWLRKEKLTGNTLVHYHANQFQDVQQELQGQKTP